MTLCLNRQAHGGVAARLHAILTSSLDGMVSFTLRQLYLRRDITRYPSDKTADGLQSASAHFEGEESSPAPARSLPSSVKSSSQ